MPEMATTHRRRSARVVPGVLRRQRRDRPPLSPAGRNRHAVLHHGRRRVDCTDGTVTVRDRDTLQQERVACGRSCATYHRRADRTNERADARAPATRRRRRSRKRSRARATSRTRVSSRRRSCSRSTSAYATSSATEALGAHARAVPRCARGKRGAALRAHPARVADRIAGVARSSPSSTSARSRGRARRSSASADGRADPVPGSRRSRSRTTPDRARAARARRGARASSSRRSTRRCGCERLQREKDYHRIAGASPASYNASFEAADAASRSRRCATSASSSSATPRRCGTTRCRGVLKRSLGIKPSRGDARRRARAVSRVASTTAHFPAKPDGIGDPAPGDGDGNRSDARTDESSSTWASGRKALARVLRAGARAGRGVSRAASARRAERLQHVPARARARAAFREHARGLSVRVPVARRQLGDRVVRDAVRPPHAGRAAGSLRYTRARTSRHAGASSARPDSRSCISCVATARSSSTKRRLYGGTKYAGMSCPTFMSTR